MRTLVCFPSVCTSKIRNSMRLDMPCLCLQKVDAYNAKKPHECGFREHEKSSPKGALCGCYLLSLLRMLRICACVLAMEAMSASSFSTRFVSVLEVFATCFVTFLATVFADFIAGLDLASASSVPSLRVKTIGSSPRNLAIEL
nr:MAG TPA: hypothetical protein [Caudoviricetes sp.]